MMNEFIAAHFISSINTELYKEPYYEKFIKIANDIARIYKNNPQNYFLPFTYMQHYYNPFTYTQNFKHIRQGLNKDWLRCGHDNAGVDCSQIISKCLVGNEIDEINTFEGSPVLIEIKLKSGEVFVMHFDLNDDIEVYSIEHQTIDPEYNIKRIKRVDIDPWETAYYPLAKDSNLSYTVYQRDVHIILEHGSEYCIKIRDKMRRGECGTTMLRMTRIGYDNNAINSLMHLYRKTFYIHRQPTEFEYMRYDHDEIYLPNIKCIYPPTPASYPGSLINSNAIIFVDRNNRAYALTHINTGKEQSLLHACPYFLDIFKGDIKLHYVNNRQGYKNECKVTIEGEGVPSVSLNWTIESSVPENHAISNMYLSIINLGLERMKVTPVKVMPKRRNRRKINVRRKKHIRSMGIK